MEFGEKYGKTVKLSGMKDRLRMHNACTVSPVTFDGSVCTEKYCHFFLSVIK